MKFFGFLSKKKEQPAAEIIRDLCDGAEELLKGAAKWVR